MEDNDISIKEQSFSHVEHKNNIQSNIKNNDKNSLKNNRINKNPRKRKRDYSPNMDIMNIEENQISDEKNNINNRKKKMKIPLRKLVERISLEEKNDNLDKIGKNKAKNNNKNKTKNKKKGIKIFSDMSVSEISNNLFKNFYPCLIPPYYLEQIKDQILENQLDKLISNFNNSKNDINTEAKIKINQNMDYLRQLAEKQGEWISNEYDEQIYDDNIDNNPDDYDESDSNNENNSNNTYPEEESSETEGGGENNFEYEDYDNNDDYGDDEY